MSTFQKLQQFIGGEMRMSQVYQPVMLIELLKGGGVASIAQIAQAILDRDPTQIEYYGQIVKNMVGRVLTKSRGITERDGESYRLNDAASLTPNEVESLIVLCKKKIDEFEEKRGKAVWEHRRRGHRPVPGSVRYEVLHRAKFRCELCGISAEVKNLEVDHIFPKSRGGRDDQSNYQALCYSCNAAKGNTDDTDFREFKSLCEHREATCLFCQMQLQAKPRLIAQNNLAYAIRDEFPVTMGHTLFIPKRHIGDYFGLLPAEVNAVNTLMAAQRGMLLAGDSTIEAFNIGMNCGEAAGQTVFHCHVHLIPRRSGDVPSPRGGIRNLLGMTSGY